MQDQTLEQFDITQLFTDPSPNSALTMADILAGGVYIDPVTGLPAAAPNSNVQVNQILAGGSIEKASFRSGYSDARVEIFPDADKTIGFISYGDTGNIVFETIVAGANVGDVIIGNYNGGQGAKWDQSAGTFTIKGALSAGSLDIPDTTTANSFHVDNTGNVWWGCNNADFISDHNNAIAYILKTGVAKFTNITITGGALNINGGIVSIDTLGNTIFKSLQIGGTNRQYSVGDAGIYSFGDGSDGPTTVSVDATMVRDMYYTDLTINSGKTLNTSGYRIFVQGTLTVNGTISRNGNNGSNGVTATGSGAAAGGLGGAALPDGYLKGSLAGATGGTSSGGVGGTGANTSNSLGSNASNGGRGGPQFSGGGWNAGGGLGPGGTVTASNVKLIANWHLATLLDISSTGATVKFNNSAAAGGGGSGGANTSNNHNGGGGGGGGSNGGIIAIYAKVIVIAASGVISANGGNGGNGGDGFQTGGGGGGGGGANGGQVILVYNSLTNGGSIVATAGGGGTKGICPTGGSTNDGVDGDPGTNGTVYQFQLSL